MNTLKIVMASLSEARSNKDAAKERWLQSLAEMSEDQATLKQAFLNTDAIWAREAQTLTDAITALKAIFCFELALSLLDSEETETLRKLVADFRLDHLTDPFRQPTLPELADTWYRAEGMHEAATTMLARFWKLETDTTFAAVLAEQDMARKPEAWSATVQAYNFIYAAMEANKTEEDEEALISSSLHFLDRHLLKQYDDLTAKLARQLEEASDRGDVSSVLEDLEPEICRVIQGALSSGLIRHKLPQAEVAPEIRGVAFAQEQDEEQGEEEEKEEKEK